MTCVDKNIIKSVFVFTFYALISASCHFTYTFTPQVIVIYYSMPSISKGVILAAAGAASALAVILLYRNRRQIIDFIENKSVAIAKVSDLQKAFKVFLYWQGRITRTVGSD